MAKIIFPSLIIFALLSGSSAQGFWGGDCFWGGCGGTEKEKPDLKIDYSGYYNKAVDGDPNAGFWTPTDLSCQHFFEFDDLKPGDFGEGTISLHLKKKDAWACATIRPTRNDDHGSNEPELEVDQPDRRIDKWDGELAENLKFRIWADICATGPARPGDNLFQAGCDRLLLEDEGPVRTVKWPLADSRNANVFSGQIEPLKKNNTYYLGADWRLPAETGNQVQSDSYQADISFSVVGSEGNRSFRCDGASDPCGGANGPGCGGGGSGGWDFSDFFNFCWAGRCS